MHEQFLPQNYQIYLLFSLDIKRFDDRKDQRELLFVSWTNVQGIGGAQILYEQPQQQLNEPYVS